MKIKQILILSLLLAMTDFLYAQTTISKDEFNKKLEERIVSKPPSYDSTKTLEEQFKPENQFQFIGMQLYLPPVIHPEAGPVIFSVSNNGFDKGNKYFTITDVLQGNVIQQLKQKNVFNQCGFRYKNLDSLELNDVIIFTIIELRDNSKKESPPLYWIVCQSKRRPYCNSNYNAFISVPYFEKQKQTFKNQPVIYLSDKTKWFCKDVTLLKNWNNDSQDSIYDIFCILKNDNNKQMQLKPPSDKNGRSFITESEYIRLDHANRNQKEQLLKEISDRQEKHRIECVTKFGKKYGEFIAQNKIEVGMTIEMCEVAWGTPWNISKITSTRTKEIWFYNWKYKLYFENKTLVKIEH
jgi:hypothetical protein